jgi:hypothetical protein
MLMNFEIKGKGLVMKRKEYILLLSASIIASLLGGLLSGYIFSGKTAIAEESPQTGLVKAEQIQLVGKDGKLLAILAASEDTGEPFFAIYSRKDNNYRAMIDLFGGGPRLILRDVTGQTRATFGATEVVDKNKGILEKRAVSSLTFFDSDGKLIWSAP